MEDRVLVVFAFWALNFAISILNAWSCGKTWLASKERGGLAYFMNWMAAIMSASGFTWCYTLLLGGIFASVPVKLEGMEVAKPLVTPEMLQAIMDLGYLVIIFPILGSGLAMTVQSWRAFSRHRSLGNGAITGWNTYAQVSNTVSALREIPNVFGRLSGFFGGSSSSSSSSNNKGAGVIVVFLVVVAVLGGIMTTFGIIRWVASNTLEYERAKAAELRYRASKLGGVGGSNSSTAAPIGR